MDIVWLTGRDLTNDLASSTEKNLVKELRLLNHNVTLVSPSKEMKNKNENDLTIKKISLPGLNTLSGARNIKRFIINDIIPYDDNTFFLIDWRYVQPLNNILNRYIKKWCIIDRGPPTYNGIFNKIQKWYWKRGWEIANKSAMGGFVVSEPHKNFVREMNDVSLKIKEIPAGSNANKYAIEKNDPNEILKITYIGRMDSRRDVESIITLTKKLIKAQITHEVNIYGGGSDNKTLEKFASVNKTIIIHEKASNSEIFNHLSYQHIGIMPMPDIPVWRISSPLKLAEYISSGLAIIGPKHPGNEFWGDGVWSMLSENSEWTRGAVENIKKYLQSDWEEISQSAIIASKNARWSRIATRIIISLEEWSIDS